MVKPVQEKAQEQSFEDWLEELKMYLVEAGYCKTKAVAEIRASATGWRGYYEDGYTSREAVREDYSYA